MILVSLQVEAARHQKVSGLLDSEIKHQLGHELVEVVGKIIIDRGGLTDLPPPRSGIWGRSA